MELPFAHIRKAGKAGWQIEDKELSFGNGKLEMSTRHLDLKKLNERVWH